MLPASPSCLVQRTVFAVSNWTQLTADYVDGDASYLVANLIPSLLEYLDERGLTVSILEQFQDRGMTLVAFHEFGHDAIKLSHIYRHTDENERKNLSVQSLRLAWSLVATSKCIYVCTRGQLDAYFKHLIVKILAVTNDTLTSKAQKQLLAGLSATQGDSCNIL